MTQNFKLLGIVAGLSVAFGLSSAVGGEVPIPTGLHAFNNAGGVGCVAFSPDGKQAISGSKDAKIRLWDVESGRLLRTLEGHEDYVRAVVFFPDGKQALSGSVDATLRIWDLATGTETRQMRGQDSYSIKRNENRWLVRLAISADGRKALSGEIQQFRFWDTETGRLLHEESSRVGLIEGVAISPDGRRAFVGGSGEIVALYDPTSGKHQTLGSHGDYLRSVAFSPNGQFAASGARNKTLFLWDVKTGKKVRSFEGHTSWVESVAFSPDGKQLLSGGRDKMLRLWNIETGEHDVLGGDEHNVFTVAFSADGRRILSGTQRGITYWDLPSKTIASDTK